MAATPIQVKLTNETIPNGAIYASPTGTTGAAGTAAAPTDIITAYNRANLTGSTICLRGASTAPYRVAPKVLEKSITWVAYPGEKPVISGAIRYAATEFVFETASSLYYHPNHDIVQQLVSADHVSAAYPQAANKQQLFINDEYYTQVQTKTEVVAKTFYVELRTETSAGKLYISDNPAGKIIEVSRQSTGFTTVAKANGSKFIGIGFERYAGSNMTIGTGSANIEFDRCTFTHSANINFQLREGNNIRILGCENSYAGHQGYQIPYPSSNMIIDGGELFGANIAKFNSAYAAAGIKITGQEHEANPATQSPIFRNMKVYNNNCAGIWLDSNVINGRVYNNECYGNSIGIFVEISTNNYVANNLCYNNTYGIYVAHSVGTEVWNNTAVLNSRNIYVKDVGRVNPTPGATNYTWRTRGTQLVNNILDSSRGSGVTSHMVYTETNVKAGTTTTAQMIPIMHHNAYYRSAVDKPTYLYRWSTTSTQGKNYADLATFKAENNTYEVGSILYTAQATHPFFTTGTMQVKSSSPTILAGAPVTGVIAEMLGKANGTVVNIGADLTVVAAPVDPNEPHDCSAEISDATVPLVAELATALDSQRALESLLEQADTALANKTTELATASALAANRAATITQLTADKTTLQTNLSTKQAQLDAAISAQTTAQAALATGQTQLAVANTNISALNASISTKDTQIGNLTVSVANLETAIATLETDKTALEATLLARDLTITELNAQLVTGGGATPAEFQEAIDILTADRTTLQSALSVKQAEIGSLQAQLTEVYSSSGSQAELLADLAAAHTANQILQTQVDTVRADAKTDIEAIKAEIYTNTTGLSFIDLKLANY